MLEKFCCECILVCIDIVNHNHYGFYRRLVPQVGQPGVKAATAWGDNIPSGFDTYRVRSATCTFGTSSTVYLEADDAYAVRKASIINSMRYMVNCIVISMVVFSKQREGSFRSACGRGRGHIRRSLTTYGPPQPVFSRRWSRRSRHTVPAS